MSFRTDGEPACLAIPPVDPHTGRTQGRLGRVALAVERIGQRVGDQPGLFGDVVGEVAGRRRWRGLPTGVVQRLALAEAGAEVMADLVPRALVAGLFLAPHHVPGLAEA